MNFFAELKRQRLQGRGRVCGGGLLLIQVATQTFPGPEPKTIYR